MWQVKILEGKDRMRKLDRTWAFPQKGFSNTMKLLLDMASPSTTWAR